MHDHRKKPKLSGGLSRLISRFNRGGSSHLVVQTGFPTSLADLVVKNLSRLKKPKSSKKRSKAPPRSFGCTREEEIVEVVCSPEEENVPVGVSNVEVSLQRLFEGHIGATKEEGGDVDVVTTQASQGNKNGMVGVQVTLVLLSALFVCSKELVLGIMAFAVALLLLESFSTRLFVFLKKKRKKKSEKDVIQSDVQQLTPEIAQESADPRTKFGVIVEEVTKNKCWRNHIAGKPRGRDTKYRTEEDHQFIVTASTEEKSAEIEDQDNKDADNDDKEEKNENASVKNVKILSLQNHIGEKKKHQIRSSNHLVLLIVVVLSGLVGGRILALGLTVISWYLVKVTRLIGRKWRIHM